MDIQKIKRVLKTPGLLFDFILRKCSYLITNDKLYLSLRYFFIYGRRINWKNPQRFNEKLQWLKVYYKHPQFTTMVDKLKAKDYVASIIGEEFIIPTLFVWDRAEDIDFDLLPEKFVLKCNHDSGTGLCVCKDKSLLNYEMVKKELSIGLNNNYYIVTREWPYKNVVPKCFAEKYMDEFGKDDLVDYKWFCFNGTPQFCQVIQNRSTRETIDFFDRDWNHQSFIGLNPLAVNAKDMPMRPQKLLLMIEIAEKLSKNLPFVRVDLYEINGKVYFGEITFYPFSGFGKFNIDKIDIELGMLVSLPTN